MSKSEAIDSLFGNSYPTEPTHEPGDPLCLKAITDRRMEVHVTRSHFGDLLIVSADTGRSTMPVQRYHEHSWLAHAFPQCNTAGGWRTRFCNGRHEQGEPNIIVGLFYRAEPDEMCDHGIMNITGAWALVIIRQRGAVVKELFMQAPMPNGACVNVLSDDGLEATHHVLVESANQGPVSKNSYSLGKLEEADVPRDVVRALRKGVEHVSWSFGQGRI